MEIRWDTSEKSINRKWEELNCIMNMVCDSRHLASCCAVWWVPPAVPSGWWQKLALISQTPRRDPDILFSLARGVLSRVSGKRKRHRRGDPDCSARFSVAFTQHRPTPPGQIAAAVAVTANDDVNSEGSKHASITPNGS